MGGGDPSSSGGPSAPAQVYHETQRRQMCAQHTLNNLERNHPSREIPSNDVMHFFFSFKSRVSRKATSIQLQISSRRLSSIRTRASGSFLKKVSSLQFRFSFMLSGLGRGLGNYDVNVLMVALQQRGFEVEWFDRRKGFLPATSMFSH